MIIAEFTISHHPDIASMAALNNYRPDVYAILGPLGEYLLHTPTLGLSCADREIIAAFVSSLNGCAYCEAIHSAIATVHLGSNMRELIENIKHDYTSSHISPQLKALLAIAEQVQKGGKNVTAEAVAKAKACGANDDDVHDTVLLAAAFCMFNRYVDGLGTCMPEDQDEVEKMAPAIAEMGYSMAPVSSRTRAERRRQIHSEPSFVK